MTTAAERIAVVTGGGSGLGLLVKDALTSSHDVVYDWSLETGIDITREANLALAASIVYDRHQHLTTLVNCAGINVLKPIENLTTAVWDAHMAVNARALWCTTQLMLARLRGGTVCNIISNASHMPMTNSLAYCASKAAAHMVTLQMARELFPKYDLTVFGISPNRLAGTPMSSSVDQQVADLRKWTPIQVKNEQRGKLPTLEETDPKALAKFIGYLLAEKANHKHLHGTVMPYGG